MRNSKYAAQCAELCPESKQELCGDRGIVSEGSAGPPWIIPLGVAARSKGDVVPFEECDLEPRATTPSRADAHAR